MRDSDSRDDATPSASWMTRIVEHARAGAFNRNPLLTTTHRVTCPQCRRRQRVCYLDYLQRGAFEVHETANIEVRTSHGPIGYLETQRFTPIVIHLVCERCLGQIEATPTSVEYLLSVIVRPPTSGRMYV